MVTIISRIFHYGFKNFWRNGWLSMATIAIMVLALFVVVSMSLFGVITKAATNSIQDKIDISVYFKETTSEDQILNVKETLESTPQVKTVDYVSRDQALEMFKEKHKNEPKISQAINELNENPLQASLNVKAQRPDQYASIAQLFDNPSLAQYVEKVSYSENQLAIDRLTAIVNNVNRGGFFLTVALVFIAGLVLFNTIRLAIYSNRDEIGIMRVVGASNSLVRGPYVVEGMLDGAIAAVLSLIVAAPIVYFSSHYLGVLIPGLNFAQYFTTHVFTLLLYQLAFGVGISAISSFVAVRRYLKN